MLGRGGLAPIPGKYLAGRQNNRKVTMFINKRFPWLPLSLVIAGLLAGTQTVRSASKNMITGPGKADLEKVGQVDVPVGYVFFDGNSTRALLKKSGEPTSGKEYGLLMPTNEGWSVM